MKFLVIFSKMVDSVTVPVRFRPNGDGIMTAQQAIFLATLRAMQKCKTVKITDEFTVFCIAVQPGAVEDRIFESIDCEGLSEVREFELINERAWAKRC